MGFPAVDFLVSSTDTSIDSVNVVDTNGSIHGVYIRTNLVSTSTLDSQSKTMSNILARVPINVASGGVIFADPSNETHKSIVDLRAVNILTVRLTDERNRILDLNGLHFQIAIAIDFIHAEKPLHRTQGGLSDSGGGSFITNDLDAPKKIANAKLQRELQAELQEKQDRARRRRGVGRPRRVGRPKGSRNKDTKINPDE